MFPQVKVLNQKEIRAHMIKFTLLFKAAEGDYFVSNL